MEYICVVCPNSCRLSVEDADGEIRVSGNQCARGVAYGRAERVNPTRMLTCTMVLRGGPIKRLPVISSAEIPKTMMSQCLDTLYRIKVNAPVKMGDIIVSDICGAGVDIVAARSVDKTDANKVDKEVIYG